MTARKPNPTGTKLLRRWYFKATGLRGDATKALRWRKALTEKYPHMRFPLGDRRNRLTS